MASDDDGPSPPPIVLYDANLLYPFHLRNLLVQLGVEHIVRPRWTVAIHDEWIRNLVASGKATRARLLHTRDIMKRVSFRFRARRRGRRTFATSPQLIYALVQQHQRVDAPPQPMRDRSVPRQLGQVLTRVGVEEAGADHAMSRIAAKLIRKRFFWVPAESEYR
jgi:hypothetical protein